MSVNVYYTIGHYNRNERLLSQVTHKSRSFVKAFLQMFYCVTSNLSQSVIDITNTSQTISNATYANMGVQHPGLSNKNDMIRCTSAPFDTFDSYPYAIFADECGIIVGTSATAVAVADDNLVAPIANGSAASQFVYYGCYGLNYTTGASSASFDLEREYRNASGGSIIVAEMGVYAATSMATQDSSSAKSFCIIRDVLGATVTVLNGEYLKVKYTITVSN